MAEDVDDNGEEEVVERGTSKLLLLAILVVGLGIGGGAAFFLIDQSASEPGEEVVEAVEEEEEVEAFDAKFVLFEAMAVPVHNSRGKYIGNYKVSIKVLTENDNDNVKVKNLKFELRHAFIARIAKGGLLIPNSTNLDYEKTTKVLKELAKNIVGEDVIYGLTIENVMRVNN